MTEKRDIVRRLQAQQSIRSISTETGMHRVTIRRIRTIAEDLGWLDTEAQLPSEGEIAGALAQHRRRPAEHPLDRIHDQLEGWLDNEYSYTVIHELVQEYYTCSEATVRRYILRTFPHHLKVVVPRTHLPGTMEVDFGYLGMSYDPREKRNRKTYVFSARFRYSRYAWRQRVYRMDQDTFLQCHINAFLFFGGVPERVVPDNLKQAILKASFAEPVPNMVYHEFAIHFGFLISPCLPGMPEHKGGVESDIKYVKHNFWPIFRERQKLKGRTVPDGDDLRVELSSWSSEKANVRKISGVGVSPKQLFDEVEQGALKPLPAERWDRLEVAQAKVQQTWSIQFSQAFYSVPWKYIGDTVRVMANHTTVRIFFDHQEIAAHPRAQKSWEIVRNRLHEPPNATAYIESTRAGTLHRANSLGADVAEVCRRLFEQKGVDGLRPARALVALAGSYGAHRLNAACIRILSFDTVSYRSVKDCLKHGLELLPLEPEPEPDRTEFAFARPADYFAAGGDA